jgi:hypothetical protein
MPEHPTLKLESGDTRMHTYTILSTRTFAPCVLHPERKIRPLLDLAEDCRQPYKQFSSKCKSGSSKVQPGRTMLRKMRTVNANGIVRNPWPSLAAYHPIGTSNTVVHGTAILSHTARVACIFNTGCAPGLQEEN